MDDAEKEIAEEHKTVQQQEKKKNWWTSLWTDREWDTDITKISGFVIAVIGCLVVGAGLWGWYKGKAGYDVVIDTGKWVVATGCALVSTGKFSREG